MPLVLRDDVATLSKLNPNSGAEADAKLPSIQFLNDVCTKVLGILASYKVIGRDMVNRQRELLSKRMFMKIGDDPSLTEAARAYGSTV